MMATCDRCNARGLVTVSRNGLDLLFCGHHFQLNEIELFLQGFVIMADARQELAEAR